MIIGLVVVVLVASELVSLLLFGEMLAQVLVEYLNDGSHLLVDQRSRSHEVNTLLCLLSRYLTGGCVRRRCRLVVIFLVFLEAF